MSKLPTCPFSTLKSTFPQANLSYFLQDWLLLIAQILTPWSPVHQSIDVRVMCYCVPLANQVMLSTSSPILSHPPHLQRHTFGQVLITPTSATKTALCSAPHSDPPQAIYHHQCDSSWNPYPYHQTPLLKGHNPQIFVRKAPSVLSLSSILSACGFLFLV